MPKRSKDPITGLRIAQECEAMIAYAYQVLRNFPKSERHVLNPIVLPGKVNEGRQDALDDPDHCACDLRRASYRKYSTPLR